MFKLYYSQGACSLAPHIALQEAGLDYELISVDLKTKKLEDGQDFLYINPKGAVPVMELSNGYKLTEGPAVLQFIADNSANNKIAPENGTIERYKLQEKLNFVTSEMHKGFAPMFAEDTPEEYKTIVMDKMQKKYEFLNKHFEDNEYLMGDNFTIADAYLFTVTRWAIGLGTDFSNLPHVNSFMDRMNKRPGVKAALEKEGILN